MNEKKTGAQAIVEALVAEKADTVFGLTGSHVLRLYDCIADTNIRLVSCKHEQSGAYMADLYGRLTGRPGIVIVTAGPGAINSLTGVAQAYGAASPMIHIAGTVDPDSPREAFHGVDNPRFMSRMFRDVTKWTTQIESVSEIPDIMAKAFHIATDGRPGPVHIDIPESLVDNEAEVPIYKPKIQQKRTILESEVEPIAKLLLEAKRPMIVGGRGIINAFANESVMKLAERVNAAVTLSNDGLAGFPHDNPRYAGLIRQWMGDPLADECLESADVILGLGLRVGTEATNRLVDLAESNDFIFVGYGDPEDQLPNSKITLFEDVGLVLPKLLETLERNNQHPAADQRFLKHVADSNQMIRDGLIKELEPYNNTTPLHFGLVVRALSDRLEDDAIVTVDNGSHNVFARLYLNIRSPTGFFTHSPWGTMGSAVPGAIAAKILHPERQVIAITGDGSFLMGCNDFGTAVENDAGIKIFLANNQQYDMIRYMHTNRYGRTVGSDILPVDFAKFAESFGATGLKINNPAAIESTVDDALKREGVVLVDVDTKIGLEYPQRSTILEKANWKRFEVKE